MSMVLSLGLDDIKGQYTIGKKKSKYNFCYEIVKLLLNSDYKIHLIFIKFEDIKSKSKRIGGNFFWADLFFLKTFKKPWKNKQLPNLLEFLKN